jgi:hypothetical protein
VEFLPDGGHAVPSELGETMQRRPRRHHTPVFQAKLAAIKAIGASWMKARFFHFVTVFGLRS